MLTAVFVSAQTIAPGMARAEFRQATHYWYRRIGSPRVNATRATRASIARFLRVKVAAMAKDIATTVCGVPGVRVERSYARTGLLAQLSCCSC